MNTQQRIDAAIEDTNFSSLEWQGFRSNPRLALTAGIAIGMNMGFDEAMKQFEPLLKKIDALKGGSHEG